MLFLLLACESPEENNASVELLSPEQVGAAIEAATDGLLRVDPTLMHEG